MDATKRFAGFLFGSLLLGAAGYGADAAPAALDRIYLGSRPTVSPDGEQFVFEWCDSLWIASTQGGAARTLQAVPSKDVWPVFSPDGKRIAFQSDRDGGWKIFELTLASGATRQISFHSESARPYGWTSDGRAVVACVVRDNDGAGPLAGRHAAARHARGR